MERFRDIYEQNANEVYRFLLTLCGDERLAEDLTQETFLRALKSIDSFRGDCKISVWLCQIAKNLFYRYRKRNCNQMFLDEIPEPADEENAEEDFLAKQQTAVILKHLHTLEDPYKEVFMLHVFGEVPLKEISLLFGKSDSWARVTFYRAKAAILDLMKGDTQ